ncbi:antitoxin Phd_YefM of type II toxin-antitoxin system [Hydromonas duriensis]|uniref:Antitoxin Phd_YefM of type II toxin-antitoxin system n=2 Tax=Hydromonas duriensis TaxID=1527608 RepID=A0A4R6Y660_9BURK|nr:antitoxin Phd_YefM of type II toxin-antitoxin system [Hydromonas duriensis]
MLTLTSSEAQNTFGSVIDRSQREIVSVTRRGRVATLVMSPQVLEDYVDGILAMQAERNGMLTAEESEAVLNKFRHA